MITQEVAEIILSHKGKMPAGWLIFTREHNEAGYLVLIIPTKHFNGYSLSDRIRIAEQTNWICSEIKATGLPCYVEKLA